MVLFLYLGRAKQYYMLLATWLMLVYFILYDFQTGKPSVIKGLLTCTYKDLVKVMRSETAVNVTETQPDDVDFGDMEEFHYVTCVENKTAYNKALGLPSARDLAHYNCSHLLMFSGSPSGRFGNTMFQVASVAGLATHHGYTPVFRHDFYLFHNVASVVGLATHHGYTPVFRHDFYFFNYFEGINKINMSLANSGPTGERVCCEYNAALRQLDHSKNWSVSGYLQSWKYMEGAKERVRKALTIQRQFRKTAERFLDAIRTAGVQNVGVHVRRRDFLSKRNTDLGYSVAPESYIRRAMQFFYIKFERVQFIFVSDDIAWCKERFNQTSHYFSPFNNPAVDMALLASCDHVIITTGTYGWMGAWLARGGATYFAGFPKPDTWLAKQFRSNDRGSDYYPPHWVAML